MLQGAIIVNGCMQTTKFEEITNMYREAAQAEGIELTRYNNNEIVYGPEGVMTPAVNEAMQAWDFVLFLDKDIALAEMFERKGLRVFNSSKVIATCDDKAKTFMALSDTDVTMPKTLIAPLIYSGMYDATNDPYLSQVEAQLTYPIVVKECFGSFGMQVYKADNRASLQALRTKLADKPHLYQAFVTSSYGKDVRVHTVGNQVVCAMLRQSETDFRANITNGGQASPFECPQSFKDAAVRIATHLGADFLGIDFLFGEMGEPVLCEVNSNAHIKHIFETTGVNVARHIMCYIKKEVSRSC